MRRRLTMIASLAALLAALWGCVQSTTPTAAHAQALYVNAGDGGVLAALAAGGGPLSDSFYTCLLNGFEQGLSFAQIQEECELKLLSFPNAVDGGPFGDVTGGPDYDPGQAVTGNCAGGDPTIAAPSGAAAISGWGEYTWGHKSAWQKGLTEDEARQRKEAAIQEAKDAEAERDKALKEFEDAVDKVEAAEKTEDEVKIQEALDAAENAKKELDKANQKVKDAIQNAQADPNEADGYVRAAQDESDCAQSLRETREFLWECFRTNWKSDACQQLQARMNDCPDPEQIYIDPEQGYSCAPSFDTEELKNAWIAQCEALVHPVDPDTNPCIPPQPDKSGRYLYEPESNSCGGPLVLVDPESDSCFATLEVQPFGVPDIQHLIVWGMNHLGGPIVVLPPRGDPTSPPGPKPTPGP
jgi:hypothetical protein